MQVVVILGHDPDSWTGGPGRFLAVAENETAAKAWIQDEVDHKHRSGTRYMQGKDADWWINYGNFSLNTVTVQ